MAAQGAICQMERIEWLSSVSQWLASSTVQTANAGIVHASPSFPTLYTRVGSDEPIQGVLLRKNVSGVLGSTVFFSAIWGDMGHRYLLPAYDHS